MRRGSLYCRLHFGQSRRFRIVLVQLQRRMLQRLRLGVGRIAETGDDYGDVIATSGFIGRAHQAAARFLRTTVLLKKLCDLEVRNASAKSIRA